MTTNGSATVLDGLVLDALGDGTRRSIIELLSGQPMAVGELADHLPVTRPAVSLHLKVLKQAQLVRDEAIGTRRVYRLDPAGVQAARAYFEQLWNESMDRFATAAEASHQRRKK